MTESDALHIDAGKKAVIDYTVELQNAADWLLDIAETNQGKPLTTEELEIVRRGSREVLKRYGLMMAATGLPTHTDPNEWVSGDDWEPLPDADWTPGPGPAYRAAHKQP